MTAASPRFPHRALSRVALAGVAVALIAVISDDPAIVELAGGALIVWVSVLIGSRLARVLAGELDPARQLVLDFWLALVVIAGLVGVGVIGAAIP
ncbi:MAG TPA: hypothetical protein VF083_14155 [Acidimicrobiia bacterium]